MGSVGEMGSSKEMEGEGKRGQHEKDAERQRWRCSAGAAGFSGKF